MKKGVLAVDKTADQSGSDSRDELFQTLFTRILDSEAFRSSPVMRGLLVYLWQHQGQAVNEYAIGVDVLGRPPDFDPKGDATVRVAIARLRKKLKEVCEGEGASAPFQLTIPLGGHEIRWVPGLNASRLSVVKALPKFYRNILWGGIAVGAILLILCALLFYQNRTLKNSLAVTRPASRLWQSFLAGGSGNAPIIVVSSPLFFQWPDDGIWLKDLSISQFQDWGSSAFAREIADRLGSPQLGTYIPLEAVRSAAKLMEYLQNLGQHPTLADSLSVGVDVLGARNSILLGSSAGDRVTQALKQTNFYIKGNVPGIVIANRNPAPGEAAEYRELALSGEHKVMPELLILLPKTQNGARSLLLLGPDTSVFTSILLTPEGLSLIDGQLRRAGFPDSWEMLFQVETHSGTVLRMQPLAVRKIGAV